MKHVIIIGAFSAAAACVVHSYKEHDDLIVVSAKEVHLDIQPSAPVLDLSLIAPLDGLEQIKAEISLANNEYSGEQVPEAPVMVILPAAPVVDGILRPPINIKSGFL